MLPKALYLEILWRIYSSTKEARDQSSASSAVWLLLRQLIDQEEEEDKDHICSTELSSDTHFFVVVEMKCKDWGVSVK